MGPLSGAGNKWYKQHLSYRLVNWPQHLPEPAVRGAVRAAFQVWSNVSALEFWEAPATGPADIRLTFFQGDHNDGLSNAFDGPGADRTSLPRGRRGPQPGEVVRGGWCGICSPCGPGQAAPPCKEPQSPHLSDGEQRPPPRHAPYGCRVRRGSARKVLCKLRRVLTTQESLLRSRHPSLAPGQACACLVPQERMFPRPRS